MMQTPKLLYPELYSDEESHSQVRLTKKISIDEYIRDPFHAIASDYDGVVELDTNKEIAHTIRPLFIERTVQKGLPLAFITGKEKTDAINEIITPFREAIVELGIKLLPNQFMVYSNNGSVVIDAGLENQIIEEKQFSMEQLETIINAEAIQALLNIYDIIETQRDNLNIIINEDASHLRQKDLSTICFRINPEDLTQEGSPLAILTLLKQAGGKQNPTRFDIAQKIKQEFAELGIQNIVVSATDRSVDITPPGSGKRQALENFSKRTGIAPDKMLRMGDSPTGMDFGLLSAQEGESRGGFTNVELNMDQLEIIQSDPENIGSIPPMEIYTGDDQFGKVIWLMQNIQTAPQPPVKWS